MTWQSKKHNVCVPHRDQTSSLLCISSTPLVLSTILIRSTTWIRWRPYADSKHVFVFTSLDCEKQSKEWGYPFIWSQSRERLHGHETTIWQVSEIRCVISVKKIQTLLRGLDEVSQLLYKVGHQIFADSHQAVWQAGHKSRPSIGKHKTLWSSIPTNTFNIIRYRM